MSSGIVAFAFGFPETIVANKFIADIATRESARLSAPIFTQREVKLPNADYADADGPQGPIPTLRMSRAAVQWAHFRQLDELVIVAAHHHRWRCVQDLEYAVHEVNFKVAVRSSPLITEIRKSDWFRGDSRQWYTNNRLAWYMRDTVLRLMPMSLYTRIAS